MRVRITRPTIAQPRGEPPRVVEPGEEIELDAFQAGQLLALRRAVLVESPDSPNARVTPEEGLPRRAMRKREEKSR